MAQSERKGAHCPQAHRWKQSRAGTEVSIPQHLPPAPPLHGMCPQRPLIVAWRTSSELICLGRKIVMTKQKEGKKKKQTWEKSTRDGGHSKFQLPAKNPTKQASKQTTKKNKPELRYVSQRLRSFAVSLSCEEATLDIRTRTPYSMPPTDPPWCWISGHPTLPEGPTYEMASTMASPMRMEHTAWSSR